eukprot:362012-Chlamydomonas_euryale.AAC.9
MNQLCLHLPWPVQGMTGLPSEHLIPFTTHPQLTKHQEDDSTVLSTEDEWDTPASVDLAVLQKATWSFPSKQIYRERTHQWYACVTRSKTDGIIQRVGRCHKGSATVNGPEPPCSNPTPPTGTYRWASKGIPLKSRGVQQADP